jgi:NAD-dependent oxidoreductase involved in siderophore biosynthesis
LSNGIYPGFHCLVSPFSGIMGETAGRTRRAGSYARVHYMDKLTEPVKVGVIGVGYLGRFHAEKYAALAETELVGVADLNRDQARKVAHALHTRDFEDYRELLPLVSAVSVAVPTSQHFAVVRDCLAAGCQVLVEKPITTTVAEADELVHLSRERGLVLMVGGSTPPWKSSKAG